MLVVAKGLPFETTFAQRLEKPILIEDNTRVSLKSLTVTARSSFIDVNDDNNKLLILLDYGSNAFEYPPTVDVLKDGFLSTAANVLGGSFVEATFINGKYSIKGFVTMANNVFNAALAAAGYGSTYKLEIVTNLDANKITGIEEVKMAFQFSTYSEAVKSVALSDFQLFPPTTLVGYKGATLFGSSTGPPNPVTSIRYYDDLASINVCLFTSGKEGSAFILGATDFFPNTIPTNPYDDYIVARIASGKSAYMVRPFTPIQGISHNKYTYLPDPSRYGQHNVMKEKMQPAQAEDLTIPDTIKERIYQKALDATTIDDTTGIISVKDKYLATTMSYARILENISKVDDTLQPTSDTTVKSYVFGTCVRTYCFRDGTDKGSIQDEFAITLVPTMGVTGDVEANDAKHGLRITSSFDALQPVLKNTDNYTYSPNVGIFPSTEIQAVSSTLPLLMGQIPRNYTSYKVLDAISDGSTHTKFFTSPDAFYDNFRDDSNPPSFFYTSETSSLETPTGDATPFTPDATNHTVTIPIRVTLVTVPITIDVKGPAITAYATVAFVTYQPATGAKFALMKPVGDDVRGCVSEYFMYQRTATEKVADNLNGTGPTNIGYAVTDIMCVQSTDKNRVLNPFMVEDVIFSRPTNSATPSTVSITPTHINHDDMYTGVAYSSSLSVGGYAEGDLYIEAPTAVHSAYLDTFTTVRHPTTAYFRFDDLSDINVIDIPDMVESEPFTVFVSFHVNDIHLSSDCDVPVYFDMYDDGGSIVLATEVSSHPLPTYPTNSTYVSDLKHASELSQSNGHILTYAATFLYPGGSTNIKVRYMTVDTTALAPPVSSYDPSYELYVFGTLQSDPTQTGFLYPVVQTVTDADTKWGVGLHSAVTMIDELGIYTTIGGTFTVYVKTPAPTLLKKDLTKAFYEVGGIPLRMIPPEKLLTPSDTIVFTELDIHVAPGYGMISDNYTHVLNESDISTVPGGSAIGGQFIYSIALRQWLGLQTYNNDGNTNNQDYNATWFHTADYKNGATDYPAILSIDSTLPIGNSKIEQSEFTVTINNLNITGFTSHTPTPILASVTNLQAVANSGEYIQAGSGDLLVSKYTYTPDIGSAMSVYVPQKVTLFYLSISLNNKDGSYINNNGVVYQLEVELYFDKRVTSLTTATIKSLSDGKKDKPDIPAPNNPIPYRNMKRPKL